MRVKPETEARIRNVQKFGKNGWQFCTLAGFFLGVYVLGAWVKIVLTSAGGRIDVGTFYSVNVDLLASASAKVWAFVVVTVVAGLFGWTLLHLYRLFRHLEAGSIYTKQNVYHLRQVGWLSMALALIQLLFPLLSFVLAELQLIDGTLVPPAGPPANGVSMLFGQSFAGVITASLILLASWIMDVGREISDDAEAMRREADLVI
jgi:hypothetical protein